jgi:hypothetical protein
MGLPIFETSVRTSQVTSGQVLCSLLPQAAALGTGRIIRLRGMAISNTTATGFGIGWGLATAAGATPGGAAGVIGDSDLDVGRRRGADGATGRDRAAVRDLEHRHGPGIRRDPLVGGVTTRDRS